MLKNNRHMITIFTIAVVVCLYCRCGTTTAGGSEIGNPRTTIAGIISDSTGAGVASVTIYLTDPLTAMPDTVVAALTGPDGHYEIRELPSGIFYLSAVKPDGDAMLMRSISTIEHDDAGAPLDLGTDTLQPPATIVISVDICSNDTQQLFIPGTIFRTHIDTCGVYQLQCPAMQSAVYLRSEDSVLQLTTEQTFIAGGWHDFTEESFIVPTPNITSGTVSGTTEWEYTFVAGEVTIDPPHPADYRFDWGDGEISGWDRSLQCTHTWNSAGIYSVRVQARSVRDTLSLSSWSEAISVTIR
jgi:hypothetical protein